jgi:D-alanyl-D-alanine carboxypeptidase
MIAHSGHVAGFSAYLLYLPDSRTSVAVLQNIERSKGVVDPTQSARQLAAFAIGEPYALPKPIAVHDAMLRQVAGVYGADPPGSRESSTQGARVLCVIGDKLTMASTGGDRAQLIPIAPDTFQSAETFDRIHLERDPTGRIIGVRFFAWGEGDGLKLARTRERPPMAIRFAPSRRSIERLVGTYATDGMNVQILLDGDRLKALPSGQAPVTLFAESPDRFLVAEVEASMEFSPAGGVPQLVTLHQGSETVAFKRKP